MNVKFKFFCVAIVLACHSAAAQQIMLLQQFNKNIPPINFPLNRIYNSGGLNNFFIKLQQLKTNKNAVITIVHIGDSHIQADYLSGFMRQNLQSFFGNAGRGLVFPYQLAKSNAPLDISSSTTTFWLYNRIAHPEILINPGITGYVIQTNNPSANLEISLKSNVYDSALYFKKLLFFLDSNKTNSWVVHAQNNPLTYFINHADSSLPGSYQAVILDSLTNNFSIMAVPATTLKSFYGVSLQNEQPGILYHTIGVNGARYDQYNNAPLFWKQLAYLPADLYIISLGTNEAQQNFFNEPNFRTQVSWMIANIKRVNPAAEVLITTAPDSYKGKKANPVLAQLNVALANYCTEFKIPLWDLYRTTNGYGSCYSWFSKNLMRPDKIHFTADGYRLQGQLFFNALSKAYNDAIVP